MITSTTMDNNSDITKVCRTCLNQSKLMRTIFEVKLHEIHVIDFIRRLTSIKVTKFDELPSNICMSCINKLYKAFDFAQICANSDKKLKEWLNNRKAEPQQCPVEAENRDKCNDKGIKKQIEQTRDAVIVISNNGRWEDDEINNLLEVDMSLSENEDIQEDQSDLTTQYRCDICCKSYTEAAELKAHSQIHNKIQNVFICNVCGQRFSYLYLLQKHSFKHQGDKPFPCTYCDKGCVTAESLRRHMKTHEADYVKKTHVCNVCSKEFRYRSFLAEHMKNHTGERPFLCSVCGKGYRQSGALQYHIRSHTGSRPYPCSVCSKSFSSPGVLKIHMRGHTNERPYVCDICGMAFRQSTDMRSHKRTHTGEKPALCTICGKRFSSSSQLNIHVRSHTGEKPFPCSTCSKSFATRDMLVKHERIHTGEKPYVCKICLKAFNQCGTLKTHLNTHKSPKPTIERNVEKRRLDEDKKADVVIPSSSLTILSNVK